MKTGVLATKNISSDDLKSEKTIMGMSMKGMEMAQYFLRDKIYSDKILAVIREYICNAYDEHIKHDIQEDVVVSFKSVNSQSMWSVRDYALGLNEHDIRNVFAMYFESTKSGDNDAIGGFGVGGKAAFAYTDTFYVTSHHEGLKTSYICTLGAGQQGIPIGEIYRVSEEPTTEQGIEVSLEVKQEDYYNFANKTSQFVSNFLPDAKLRYDNGVTTTTPTIPLDSLTVNGYTIHAYESFPNAQYGTSYNVRMGGVVYPYKTSIKVPRQPAKSMVVDVPIGKLTIPISRESIENLPSNERVFQEIEDILTKISDDEIANLTPPKFGNVVSKHEKTGQDYLGKWYRYQYAKTFASTYKFYNRITRGIHDPNGYDHNCYEPLPMYKGETKHSIFVFPSIKNSLRDWHTRLRTALIAMYGADYKGYMWTSEKSADEILAAVGGIDLSDCAFIKVKDLKLKKLDKVKQAKQEKFMVYGRYFDGKYFTESSYSIEEVDAWTTEHIFNNVQPAKDWYLHTKSEVQLNARTIGTTARWGTRTNIFTANSIKLVEGLHALGWLDPDSTEYQDRVKHFRLEYEKKQVLASLDADARQVLFKTGVQAHTLKALKSNPDKLNKLKAVKEKILQETSTRARILRVVNTQYHNGISRDDLRKIMTLK
jgi:hypothetical protein